MSDIESKVISFNFRKNRRTICVNCKHHEQGERSSDYWSHICLAPELQRQEVQDPVTGKRAYSLVNDLGNEVFVNDLHPNCREVNTRGDCQHYVAKTELHPVV